VRGLLEAVIQTSLIEGGASILSTETNRHNFAVNTGLISTSLRSQIVRIVREVLQSNGIDTWIQNSTALEDLDTISGESGITGARIV
jgi:hypothetical protein